MNSTMLKANLLAIFWTILVLVPTVHLLPTNRGRRDAAPSRENICQLMSNSEAVFIPIGIPASQVPTPDAQGLSLQSAQKSERAATQCRRAQRTIVQKALNGDDSLIKYLVSLPHRPVCQIAFLPLPETDRSSFAVTALLAEPVTLIQQTFTKFLTLDHVLAEVHRYQLYHVDSHFLGRVDHEAIVDAIYHGPMANVRQALCGITEVAAARKLELDFTLSAEVEQFEMPDFETQQMAYIHAYTVLEDIHLYLDFAAYVFSTLAEVPVA